MSFTNTPELDAHHALLPLHRTILEQRAIPIDVALKAGVRSVDLRDLIAARDRKQKPEWPHLPLHPVTGLLIPYQPCRDGIPRCRVRSDVDEYVKPGPIEGSHHGEQTIKVPRYICQAEVGVVPYLLTEVLRLADNPAAPLYFVEAPLKALCLTAHGFPAVGPGGVLAGAHDPKALNDINEIVAHAELRRIRWRGRRAYVVFDAGLCDADDHPGNPMVALGAAYLAKALGDLGADIYLVRVPYYHPEQSRPESGAVWTAEDQGPDDFIARNGVEAFQALVDGAVAADPPARMQQALDGLAPADRPKAAGDLLRELFFGASLHVGGDAVMASVAAITSQRAGLGKKALKQAGAAFKDRISRRMRGEQPEWVGNLIVSPTGGPRSVRENVELCLRNDAGLKGLLAFDEFSTSVGFTREPPWIVQYPASKGTKAHDPWTDEDDTRLAGYLAARYGLIDLTEAKVRAAINVVARDHHVHPVRDYLKGLTWDGTARVGSWLTDYFGVRASEYVSRVGRWWLISAVARIMKPGCQVDHTLVLEGEQGLAKSGGLRVLGGEFFSDADLGDLRSKEAAMALQGLWILELAEGEVFTRATTKALKAFCTKRPDDIIPKFSNRKTKLERQCVFALTINNEADYLMDTTGNRRFWPVRCMNIDLDGLLRDRDQLWAEAVAVYQAGERWWPSTKEERDLCKAEQDERQAHDPWEETILRGLSKIEKTTIEGVLDEILTISHDRRTHGVRLRVSACLRGLGWREDPALRKKSIRYWVRGPEAEPMADGAVSDADLAALVAKGEHLRIVEALPSEGDDALDAMRDVMGTI